MVVLDEADEMLNMDSLRDMETILGELPEERQTVMFSATMPPRDRPDRPEVPEGPEDGSGRKEGTDGSESDPVLL